MTQAYNLAILANAVDSSGKLNVGTNATGTLPLANGGTGTTNTVNSVVAGTGISISTSGTQVTVSASGGTGVTSLNGQTGAITDTTLGNIGSVIMASPANTTRYLPGATIAGSSLYYATTSISGSSDGIVTNGVNPGGGIGTIMYNDGTYARRYCGVGGVAAPLGASTLSGTWRAMGPIGNSTWFQYPCFNLTDVGGSGGLWVRVS